MKTIGNRLRYLLNKHNMRAVDLSRQLRLPLSTISNILNDRYEPGVYKIQQLAQFFNVDLNWLITGKTTAEKLHTEPTYIVEDRDRILSTFEELGQAIASEVKKLPSELQSHYWNLLIHFYQILIKMNQ